MNMCWVTMLNFVLCAMLLIKIQFQETKNKNKFCDITQFAWDRLWAHGVVETFAKWIWSLPGSGETWSELQRMKQIALKGEAC